MGFLVTWVLLAALWIGLSGYTDAIHLTFGFVSVTLVSALSHRHLTGEGSVPRGLGRLLRLAAYVPWLLWQIVLANVDVMLRILGARGIDPLVVRLKPDLQTEFGLTALANSITLTPGTVTVDIEDGEFIIHAISREAAQGLLDGAMARKVRAVEGQV